jgi:hypothetical protein
MRDKTMHRCQRRDGHANNLRNPASGSVADNTAIICRNNAPLFKMAAGLLGAKRNVAVSRSNIDPKFIGIVRKRDRDECLRVLASFEQTLSEAPGDVEISCERAKR